MKWPLVTMPIEVEEDVVALRQRVKVIAGYLGFSTQDQTRIATALSEIARNCYAYAERGKAEVGIAECDGEQALEIKVSDKGAGIADLRAILDGSYVSKTGLGLGITGARRLMDRLEISSASGTGTIVTMAKQLPAGSPPFDARRASAIVDTLTRHKSVDLSIATREQNRDLLQSLTALHEREVEAKRLNAELAETNRGVVALYAELERTAEELRIAGETLEATVVQRTAELAESNEKLKAEAEARERLGDDLRQAQKMEAVGQLTGGIAHDFNNLLTGIIGSLDIMRRRIRQQRFDKLEHYIEIAMGSADRAASLTHRLLAFSRRQPLDPRITDVNSLIIGMEDLVRRSINETIDLRIEPCTTPCTTLCDAHQLENAILNLTINARDAMPTGGSLTIACTLVEAVPPTCTAKSVCIAVTDTGTGMTSEVVARAFDPFFTTKPLGKGTGLGLSMIYGFARQSGGEASIESRIGAGTTIRINLPFISGVAAVAKAVELADAQPGRGEKILVVEDDDAVRTLVVGALREAGYEVRSAIDGPSGLSELMGPDDADLVVSDVGLPGLNGRQMADAAREARPHLKILFMTGYAENTTAADGFLEAGMEIIAKPFSIDVLLARVTHMLQDKFVSRR